MIETSKYSIGPLPSWVKEIGVPIESSVEPSTQVNTYQLLIDNQRNLETKTTYWHFAIKALSQQGIDQIAQFNITFTTHQRVTIHTIRVYRNGTWHDRLNLTRIELLKREQALECNIYRGNLTLAHFLADIRVGDIVEYACSFEGGVLFFNFSDWLVMADQVATSRNYQRIIAHPSRPLFFKTFNTNLEPKITDISSEMREWVWESFSTESLPHEPAQPSWYNLSQCIQVSEYGSWKEFACHVYPLYKLSDDFRERLTPDMLRLVNVWRESESNQVKQALLAVRFVQDEVRYFGFEEGIGSFKPADPIQVFEDRFGDCKGKTFLLHALLYLMGIPSTSILVHSWNHQYLPDVLPSPDIFNHVVLRVETQDSVFWVDPTLSCQGGQLQDLYFPNFHWGFAVQETATELIPLPKREIRKQTDFHTSIVLTQPEFCMVTFEAVYQDRTADYFRRRLAFQGIKEYAKDLLKDAQQLYGDISACQPLKVLDDRDKNILTIIENYRIENNLLDGRRYFLFYSLVIRNLDRGVNLDRTAPYSLTFPLWVKETVSIDNPLQLWSFEQSVLEHKHESFHYSHNLKFDGQCGDFEFELLHTKDHVSKEGLREYWNLIKGINEFEGLKIWIDLPSEASLNRKFYHRIPLVAWARSFYKKIMAKHA